MPDLRTWRVAVVGGDHIGPEVAAAACEVLTTVEAAGFCAFEFDQYPWGAQHYLDTGAPMDPDAVEQLRRHDAVLFGAHGDPAKVPERVTGQHMLHRLRKLLGLGVNLRPARTLRGVPTPLKEGRPVDLMIVRENTEGAYTGSGVRLHQDTSFELATQPIVVTRGATERVARYAFALARQRRGRLACVTKGSALGDVLGVWTDVTKEVSRGYPDVEVDTVNVDAMAMYLVIHPERFDVVMCPNLMGDVLSDLASAVVGGIGLAPSASIDPTRSAPGIFEPVHGSAPDLAGRDIANPVGAIRSAAMMLQWLGEAQAARSIEQAVEAVVGDPALRTPDLGGTGSLSGCTEAITERVARSTRSPDS